MLEKMELQLGLSQLRTIHPHTLIILLRHLKDRQLLRHDPPGPRSRDNSVLGEIRNTAMVAQEVLIKDQLAIHDVCGTVQNTQNSIREDRLSILAICFNAQTGLLTGFLRSAFRLGSSFIVASVAADSMDLKESEYINSRRSRNVPLQARYW